MPHDGFSSAQSWSCREHLPAEVLVQSSLAGPEACRCTGQPVTVPAGADCSPRARMLAVARMSAAPEARLGSSRCRQHLSRWLIAWVGMLCLGSQLAGVAHLLLSAHVRCAEHGEWVHHEDGVSSSREGGTNAASDQRLGRVFDGVAFRDAAGTAGEHDHDHCAVAVSRRALVTAAPAPLALGPLEPTPLADLGGEASKRRPVVVSFAPKTSPPALG